MNQSSSFVHHFLRRLHESRVVQKDASDLDPPVVLSSSTPQAFQLGTGASIFTHTLIPAIVSAKSEIIFVTCFWAPSKTLSALHDALTKLAAHRLNLAKSTNTNGLNPLKISICLSSRSLFQKLFHPQSRDGYVYPPSSWQKDFGLPDPELLKAAHIDLHVKSLFFLPFSVMHPKFVIIDRRHAFVPSCNVSWEAWLEGCVEVTGDAVQHLMSFYSLTWDRDLDHRQPLQGLGPQNTMLDARQVGLALVPSSAHIHATIPTTIESLPTLVLPSQFHRNPHFRPFPWQKTRKPPPTPLNIAVLDLFDQARRSIYIQTPNLTCEPVVIALLDAVTRGVDVTIVTSRNMMLLEQLVTAGTTTSWCVRSLVRRYRKLSERLSHDVDDVEATRPSLGQLRISYFRPRRVAQAVGHETEPLIVAATQEEEPVHSHLKLTIVDGEYTILGSGNMDRASWYTSQELGILFHDGQFAATVKSTVERVLDTRLDLVYSSAES